MEGPCHPLQLDAAPGAGQRLRVGRALVPQAIELFHLHIGVGQAPEVLRLHGRGIRPEAAPAAAQVELPHLPVQAGVPAGAVGELLHGGRLHPGIGDRVDQHLKAQPGPALVPRPEDAGRCQRSPGAVAAHGDPVRVDAQLCTVLPHELQRLAAVLERQRERRPLAGAVVDEHHLAARPPAVIHHVPVDVSRIGKAEPAPMEIHQAGQLSCCALRLIQGQGHLLPAGDLYHLPAAPQPRHHRRQRHPGQHPVAQRRHPRAERPARHYKQVHGRAALCQGVLAVPADFPGRCAQSQGRRPLDRRFHKPNLPRDVLPLTLVAPALSPNVLRRPRPEA